MIVKLLTEHHLEFLSLKGGSRGSSESTLVKMSNCWKSHALAHYDTFLKANNKCTDQTAQISMHRLVCTFVVRRPPKTGFSRRGPILYVN